MSPEEEITILRGILLDMYAYRQAVPPHLREFETVVERRLQKLDIQREQTCNLKT